MFKNENLIYIEKNDTIENLCMALYYVRSNAEDYILTKITAN